MGGQLTEPRNHAPSTMASQNQGSAFKQFEDFLDKIPIMQQLEEKTTIAKVPLAGGVISVLLLVVLFGWGASVLSMLVGFIYPAFSSFKALEQAGNEIIRFWLIYWVVYACFSVAET